MIKTPIAKALVQFFTLLLPRKSAFGSSGYQKLVF